MIELEGWDAVRQEVVRREVQLENHRPVGTLFLPPERCLHAAVGVHLDGGRRLVLGVVTERSDKFSLTVEQIDGKFHFDADGNVIYYLPYKGGYHINRPTQTSTGATKIDVVFLVDGTMRLAPRRFLFDRITARQAAGSLTIPGGSETEAAQSPAAIGPDTARAALFGPILEALSRAVSGENGADLHASVCSFADLKTNGLLDATDLQPDYVTSPSAPKLQKVSQIAGLQRMLDEVRPSSGADFVDAVSEGLELCNTIRWRPDSRRIVILVGDSPGFSFRHPIEGQMDLHARALDVHIEAERLAVKGVEIVTVFSGLGQIPNSTPKPLIGPIAATREQYRALASSDDHAFTMEWDRNAASPIADFGERLPALLGRDLPPKWLGRGVCWAIFGGLTEPRP
jgi:hypothetical protein